MRLFSSRVISVTSSGSVTGSGAPQVRVMPRGASWACAVQTDCASSLRSAHSFTSFWVPCSSRVMCSSWVMSRDICRACPWMTSTPAR